MAVSPTMFAEIRLVRRLRQADARTPATARVLPALPPLEEQALRDLASRSIVIEPSQGGYFLDEGAYARLRRHRTRIVTSILAVSVVVLTATVWVLDRIL